MKQKSRVYLFFLGLLTCVVPHMFGGTSCQDTCDCEPISKTYLWVPPQFQAATPELVSGFHDDRLHLKEDGIQGAIQVVAFGGKSNNPEQIARYFLPFCQTSVVVDEKTTSIELNCITAEVPPEVEVDNRKQDNREMLATNFNIFTETGCFRSVIGICPKQSVAGVGFHWRQSFCRDDEKGRGWWTAVHFPIERVKNDLHFREQILDDGGGPLCDADENVVANMTQAMQQSEWRFGKICCDSMRETGVADVTVKLGYEWLEREPCHLESYIGVIIPTGTNPKGEFLFEPVVGNGRHAGVIFGNNGGVHLWECCSDPNKTLRVEWSCNSQYLFSHKTCRSFDLFCKPWTRYASVYRNKEQAEEAEVIYNQAGNEDMGRNLATPGINVFTQCVKVRPGFSYRQNTALVFASDCVDFEAGFNFFARQNECVELVCPWKEEVALKHKDGAGQTNPIRDITRNGFLEDSFAVSLEDYEKSIITGRDIDLKSAASPCALSYILYGYLGYRHDDCECPYFVGLGGSGEWSRSSNAVLERWLIWAKAGISF